MSRVVVGLGVFVFLCWPDMVPNQRQLFIVVSDWGSYLGSPVSHFLVWDLVYVTVNTRLYSFTFHFVISLVCSVFHSFNK
jgi:hypothetical protein